jgi:hypothetical protein
MDANPIQVLCEMALVLMQFAHAYRHTRKLGSLTPLLRTLYVDGFAYFVTVVTLRLWTALTVCRRFLSHHPSSQPHPILKSYCSTRFTGYRNFDVFQSSSHSLSLPTFPTGISRHTSSSA